MMMFIGPRHSNGAIRVMSATGVARSDEGFCSGAGGGGVRGPRAEMPRPSASNRAPLEVTPGDFVDSGRPGGRSSTHRALLEQLAQLVLGLLQRLAAAGREFLAGAVDVEGQHRHRRAQRRRLAPLAV